MDGGALAYHSPGAGNYLLGTWLFLRLMGIIYAIAFVSLAVQIKGLVGKQGILPASEFLGLRRHAGAKRLWRVPTLCWANESDGFLLFLSWGGAALALLETIGFAPVPILILLWVFYLSLATVCRIFLGYQWDILLLEAGFLAIFVAPLELLPHSPPASAPSPIVLWLLWWLLFRLMFSSGMVKLRSGDATWKNLTALCHHYETQPLPTPMAWHAHQLPARFHKGSTVVMFAVELIAPFLIVTPPPGRYVAAALFILLMALIEITGNYCFFNLLGIALSILLLDDRLLAPAFGWAFAQIDFHSSARPPAWWNGVAMLVAVLILVLSGARILRLFLIELPLPKGLLKVLQFLEPFRLVNSYGLFSVMTTDRPEIIVEGSDDAASWHPYEFKWKPGEPARRPRFVAPHQPRLDWQMWFAALSHYEYNPWLTRFLTCLLEGSPPVLALLRTNPFPAKPPRYVRAILYDYRFTDRGERGQSGAWWKWEQRGWYSPIMELE
jgi:hypothetical protein